jgi:hypothetical protein
LSEITRPLMPARMFAMIASYSYEFVQDLPPIGKIIDVKNAQNHLPLSWGFGPVTDAPERCVKINGVRESQAPARKDAERSPGRVKETLMRRVESGHRIYSRSLLPLILMSNRDGLAPV